MVSIHSEVLNSVLPDSREKGSLMISLGHGIGNMICYPIW